MTSTCSPWATAADVCAPCNDEDFDDDRLDDCLQFASDVLYELSGHRWPGMCDALIRPCGVRGPGACGCGRAPHACGCGGLSELRLPADNVTAVTEVIIDGETIDPARYRLDNATWLVWQPDEDDHGSRQAWPCCQRLDRPAGDEDTW